MCAIYIITAAVNKARMHWAMGASKQAVELIERRGKMNEAELRQREWENGKTQCDQQRAFQTINAPRLVVNESESEDDAPIRTWHIANLMSEGMTAIEAYEVLYPPGTKSHLRSYVERLHAAGKFVDYDNDTHFLFGGDEGHNWFGSLRR